MTDALGVRTKNVSDALNRRVETRFADGTSTPTVYDVLGRVVSMPRWSRIFSTISGR